MGLSLFIQWDTYGKSASFRIKAYAYIRFITNRHLLFPISSTRYIIVISYETPTHIGNATGLPSSAL